MSVTISPYDLSVQNYGYAYGRGDVERHAIQTLRDWIIAYIADYERENHIVPRTIPTPPTPESIHGGIDYETFSADLFPELIVVCEPVGSVERFDDDGTYGSWFNVGVGAIVSHEGDQDRTRLFADAYGTALQKLLPQQGAFGKKADGPDFATRTRLETPYALTFPDDTVRDIVRATVEVRTFVDGLVSDYSGPRVPPADPYATPGPLPTADRVEVDLIRGTPDTEGPVTADGVVLDGTVYPPVIRYHTVTVEEDPDNIPEADLPN